MPNAWIEHLKKYRRENNVQNWMKEARKTYTPLKEIKEKKSKSATKIQALMKGVHYRSNVLPKLIENNETKKYRGY